MPQSPLELALLIQQQYDNADNSRGVFDYDFVTDGDRLSIKQFMDCAVTIDEGSHNFLNWFFNFQAEMRTVRFGSTDNIGVEFGFDLNMESSVAKTAPLLNKNMTVYCIGHSRGAGRAYIRAARMIALGYRDVRICVFGSPRPGDPVLQSILRKASEHYSFCNGEDPVCTVPYYIPPFFRYVEPVDFIMLDVPPSNNDEWGHEFGWHHMQAYIAGVTAWEKVNG